MQDETFGEVSFEQRELDAEGNASFKRRDTEPYEKLIDALVNQPKGTEAKVTVVTGEIKTDSKAGRGRGKNELSEAKTFQEVANAKGHGLRVSARHMTNGMTTLRMMLVNKRTFTDEQNANRERGQNKRRLVLAQTRASKARATLQTDANNAEAKATLDEATGRIAELEAILNGKTRTRTQAKA